MGERDHGVEQLRHAPQRAVGLAGPGVDLARPPGVRVVLGVARDLGARAAATPGRSASPSGWAGRRAPRPARARARPTTPRRARARASPSGPRRPRPRRRRRAPSGRPSSPPTARAARRASGRRCRAPRTAPPATPTRPRARAAATSASAAAPSAGRRRSRSKPARRAASPSCDGEPRSASVGDRRVGRRGALRRGLERLVGPARRHLAGLPGSAGEDAGVQRHATLRVMQRAQADGGASTGAGATRTSSRRRPSCARRRPGSPRTSGSARRRSRRPRRSSSPPPRVALAARAAPGSSARTTTRARVHAHGASYGDVVRAFRGRFPHAPDAVARPGSEEELLRVLEWAADARLAVTPYGGGTSVVGGVDPVRGPHEGAVSVDLARMDRVLEVDDGLARGADRGGRDRPAAGGSSSREHGLTLRFFPQSFEFSTLGGWIATRAAGHFATGPTHIDDLVESVRAVTAGGEVWESRRLPGSGAGPVAGPDAARLGGHAGAHHPRVGARAPARGGAPLGVGDVPLVRGRLRGGARDPAGRAAAGQLPARGRARGGADVRRRPRPARARLRGGRGRLRRRGRAVPRARRRAARERRRLRRLARRVPARAVPARHVRGDGRAVGDVRDRGHLGPAAGARRVGERRGRRRRSAARARSPAGSRTPTRTARRRTSRCSRRPSAARRRRSGTRSRPSPATRCWPAGGTITHHHAVGRDHRRWYDEQRPEPFAAAWRAAKAALDPDGRLNPGVLWEQA